MGALPSLQLQLTLMGGAEYPGSRRLDTAEFQKGDLYIVRYRPVQQLLRDKWIALI